MQRTILRNKTPIMVISGILIVFSFLMHYAFGQEQTATVGLMIASILGISPIAIQAYQSLRFRVVSIDVLVTIAVIGAFLIQNFEESAIVTFLFLFGAYLEARTLNRTRRAIKELTEMAPESALKLDEHGEFVEVEIDEVDIGDTLLVKTGAKVPVDGTVLSGNGHVNQAAITGESVPVSKADGSEVFAGTILENGTLRITADKVGEDTTFGRIIELVEEATDSKSEAERFIDRFAKWYTPAVLLLALVVYLVLQFVTHNPNAVEIAITLLVLGCPGALVIGVPVSNVAGIGNGAKHGVLLKGSEVIQDFAKTDTILFDKTGTLTLGKPQVAHASYYVDEPEALDFAKSALLSVEQESDHPLAKAIVDRYDERYPTYEVSNTEVVKGGGIISHIEGKTIGIGNRVLLQALDIATTPELEQEITSLEQQGNSIVLLAIDGQVQALLGIKDTIRPGVKEDLAELKRLGVKNLVVLSGDNQATVDLVAAELGLTEAHGNMLPEDKSNYLIELQEQGHTVAFVGDGVNDSPSLALADVGIAMGSGTEVAIETADVVLINENLSRLPHALGLVKKTSANMKQNIVIAVAVVLILMAALLFSDWMNMTIGMLVHEGSILVVIFNAMRLIGYRLRRRHEPDRSIAEAAPQTLT